MLRALAAALALGLCVLGVATATAGGGQPDIRDLDATLTGSNPGPNYSVEVRAKVRVCAKQGPLRLEVRERLTGFDHPPTVIAEDDRSFSRSQASTCQRYTPSWTLGDEFFGVGVYRIRVQAIDRDGVKSSPKSVKFETTD